MSISCHTARARVEFHRRTGIMEYVVNLEKKNGYLFEVAEVDNEK